MTQRNACDEVAEDFRVISAKEEDYKNSLRSEEIYKITGPKKGLILILNNSFPDDDKKIREGSEIDVKNMKNLWLRMGCDLYKDKTHSEQTANEMKKLMEDINKIEGYGFMVIVIMTHGGVKNNESFFQGSDEKKVRVNDVIKIFYKPESRVGNIPILLIFQFCRSKKSKAQPSDGPEYDGACLSSAMASLLKSSREESSVPRPNILTAYATTYGYPALRNTTCGSLFINAITNIFMEHACKEHVGDLLLRVHRSVKAKLDSYEKGIIQHAAPAEYSTNQTKKFYLFPGYPKT